MTVGRITKRSVEAIPLPVGTARSYLWDDTLKGFGCMVMASGARSYLVQYQMGGRGTPTRRATIGRHGSPWTAEKARDRATDLLEMVRKGIDPAEHAKTEREATEARKALAERLAFSVYVDLFGRKYLDAKNLRSAEDIKATFRRDLTPAFKDRPLNTLRRVEIANRLDEISERSKSAAVKAHKWLRKLLSWAVERGDLATSPMESMSPPHPDGKTSAARSKQAGSPAAASATAARRAANRGSPRQSAAAANCAAARQRKAAARTAPKPTTRRPSNRLAKPALFAHDTREWYRSTSLIPGDFSQNP